MQHRNEYEHQLKEHAHTFITRPFLALEMLWYLAKDRRINFVCYEPESVNEQYLRFCEKLQLEHRPPVLVVKDDSFRKGLDGYYGISGKFIAVTESVFNAFQTNVPYGSYVMAHELGHAKSHQQFKRRHFLRNAIAIAGGMLIAEPLSLLTKALLDADEGAKVKPGQDPSPQPATKKYSAPWHKRFDSLAYLTSFSYSAQAFRSAFTRAEEFQADAYAKDLMPPIEIIKALTEKTEDRMFSGPKAEELLAERKKFIHLIVQMEKDRGGPVPENVSILTWALMLSEMCVPKMDLKYIVRGNYYPNDAERIQRLATIEMQRVSDKSR